MFSADGMMFGPLACCPICSGCIRFSGGMYRCHGYVSEWSKCSYTTREPKRRREKWKVPEGTSNQYLKKVGKESNVIKQIKQEKSDFIMCLQWFKSQKAEKPVRILLPSSSSTSESQIIACQHQSSNGESLGELRVAITGFPKESIV